MILFQNHGEISPLSFTVFGLNAKPDSKSPFGFFGTGLKYAIAVLLREGCRIEIQSGLTTYKFSKDSTTFRGKDFDQLWVEHTETEMDRQSLGPKTRLPFTTELGKNWALWMAYRELWCNCSDEGGTADCWWDFTDVVPEPGETKILIWGLDEIHNQRGDFILLTQPLFKTSAFEIHPGQGTKVFYRGICVGEMEKPSVLRYNFLTSMDLTEDRILKYPYMVPHYLKSWIAGELPDEALCERIITAPKGTFEHELDFSGTADPSPAFLEAAGNQIANLRCNSSARALYKLSTRKEISPRNVGLSAIRKAMLEKAIAFCHSLDFAVSEYEIVYTDSLGQGIMGLAEDNKIYLSDLPFDQGTKRLASTLIEEFLHLRHGLRDETRAFQDFLLDRIVSLGESNRGEPL